jgi:chromosome segregation ATPase
LQLHQVHEETEIYVLAEAEKQRQLEAAVRDLEELRRTKADLVSAHDLAMAAQERAHEQELEALHQQLKPRLAEFEQCLASRDTELRQAREAAELSQLQQLHLQEELEHYYLAEGEMQRQLEARVRELAELEQRLGSRETELREAREEAEMTLLQLHQVHEELEHYFLQARASDQLAQAQLEQLQRAQRLMARFNNDVLPTAPYPPALAVEVLPELAAAGPDPSVQTQALLSTYAASLKRASALLERARRS